MSRAPNSSLFHFTRSADTLRAILGEGFWPKYRVEDISWQALGDGYNFVIFPMVCFCDIPLSRISEHTKFYGSYGIGLTKEWALRNGLNPVFYLSGVNSLREAYSQISKDISEDEMGEEGGGVIEWLRHLLSFIKPLEGKTHTSSDQLVERNFYQESEWRYVPKSNKFPDHMTLSDSKDEKSALL